MWILLMIIFLASDFSVKAELTAAEQSFYDDHHAHLSPHGPIPVSYNNGHHHINSVDGYFPSDQPQVTYQQQTQPNPGNIEQQQPIAVRQLDPGNGNFSSETGGYWPLTAPHVGFNHHPGFYPNGGIAYRTEPPNLSLFGQAGFPNGVTATTTSATPTRNNVKTRQQSPTTESPPKRSHMNRFQERTKPTRRSQTLPIQKSQATRKPQKSRKLINSKENRNTNKRVFNFSYIPEELLDKGSPIHPTLEIVRDEQGIPIVVPVFRPLPQSYSTKTGSRKQNKKNQRQQDLEQQPPVFQNVPGFNNYNQSPFTIQLSPFSNQLNNPLSNTNGFVSRDIQPQTLNFTGHTLGVNFGWGSPIAIGPFHSPIHPLVHHSVPYPYSHFGWGPVYFNATQTPTVETPPARKTQKSNKVKIKPTKDTTTKSKDEEENITQEKGEEEKNDENEHNDYDETVGNKKDKKANIKNQEDDYEEEYDDDKTMEDDMTSHRNQDYYDDDSANEIEENNVHKGNENGQEEQMKMEPVALKDEENYVDTEEVSKEIPQEVLQQMIQEYNDNEKNKDTPIVLEGDQAQHVVDRLRNQIQSLLDAFSTRSRELSPKGTNYTADHADWNTRLRERYQLRTRPPGPTFS